MSAHIQPRVLKGFRDFSAEEMLRRTYVLSKIRKVVTRYGFDELQSPTLEYAETLLGNIGNDEKMIYRFCDDGKRDVALKYDQTVSTCRYIAMNYAKLPMPFKRYQIQNVFRTENTQKGRYREFLQFDADIFGVESVGADIEMILLTCDIYHELGFPDFKVLISDRALLVKYPYEVLSVIDKMDKIGEDGVIKELEGEGITGARKLVEEILHIQPNERIQAIIDAARSAGYGMQVVFDPSIMRSFSYSTGTIWEVRVEQYGSSLLGGERFDSLVSRFSDYHVPGVGFGIGFDRTLEALTYYGLTRPKQTTSQVLVTVFGENFKEISQRTTRSLQKNNIHAEMYLVYSEKLQKQLKYADKKGVRYVIIIGEDEIQKEFYTLKDLRTGEQVKDTLEKIIDIISPNIE